jgi:hypothetical protein
MDGSRHGASFDPKDSTQNMFHRSTFPAFQQPHTTITSGGAH